MPGSRPLVAPVTRQEVRAVALSKARLAPAGVIYDVGAGSGSIAIEAALLAPLASVFAIERDPERADLCRQNARRFGAGNVTVITGTAPEELQGLPDPDRVFIGGSGGNITDILADITKRLRPGGRVVVMAVTVETLADSLAFFRRKGFGLDAVQVAVARLRPLGAKQAWEGKNPIHVVTAWKADGGAAGLETGRELS